MNLLLIKALVGHEVHVANRDNAVVGVLVECAKDLFHIWSQTSINDIRNGFMFGIEGISSISSVTDGTVIIHLK